MAKKRFVFTPYLTLSGTPGDVVVAFDSAHPADATREPRLVRVPAYRSLRVRCEGLGAQADNTPHSPGAIDLIVTAVDGTETAIPLGVVTVQPSSDDVAVAVRAGLMESWSTALQDFSTRAGQVAAPSAAQFAAPGRIQPRTHRFSALTLTGVAFAGVLVAALGIAAVRRHTPPPGPAETLAARTLLADPSTVDAQIQLNNDVLKSMGLDPGAAADMGCLAAPSTPKHE